MISGLSTGVTAFAGISARSFSGGDEKQTGENVQKELILARQQNSVARQETARSVEKAAKAEKTGANGEELPEEEEKQVQQLKQRDAEVRAHEQAHAAAGGSYTSPPSYEYTVGPDGKRYAVSGEVQIDASPVRDNPEATIRKMDIVIQAALAPADPSSQDLQVAKQAQAARAQAQAELLKKRQEEQSGTDKPDQSDGVLRLVAREAYGKAESLAFQSYQGEATGKRFPNHII